MRPAGRALMAAGLLGLAGCASLAPPYERPAAPVPAAFPGTPAGQAGIPLERAAQIGWRDYFTDPTLQALIGRALDANRDLRVATLRVAEARAAYQIRRADAAPAVGAGGDLTRSRTPAGISLTGQPMVVSQYQAGIGLNTWELDFWGRIRHLSEAALESYFAADANRRAATLALVAQVADGYLTLRELDERLDLARRTTEARAETLRLFRRRHEVGSTSRLDLAQVETLLIQAQALAAQLEQARAQQANALALLVGGPLELPADARALDAAATLRALPAGLPSEQLLDRPDIQAAEHRLRAANADIGAARAAFFPRITLTGNLGFASTSLGSLFEGASRAWTFAPSLTAPIFSGGQLRASLELAEVRRDIAVADYERAIQAAFRDVADALAAQRWLAEQLAIQRQAVAVQAERARLADLRYERGAGSYLDVLDAQRDLLAAQQSAVEVRAALLSSRVALYAALGGGSLHPDAGTPPAAQP